MFVVTPSLSGVPASIGFPKSALTCSSVCPMRAKASLLKQRTIAATINVICFIVDRFEFIPALMSRVAL
jgi:hypothetical protein